MSTSKRYVALVGLRYPDGDEEYVKALDGQPYREREVAAGEECLNIPVRSVAAYATMGRPILEEIPPEPKAVKR